MLINKIKNHNSAASSKISKSFQSNNAFKKYMSPSIAKTYERQFDQVLNDDQLLDSAIKGLKTNLNDKTGGWLDVDMQNGKYCIIDNDTSIYPSKTVYSPWFNTKEELYKYLWQKSGLVPIFKISIPKQIIP